MVTAYSLYYGKFWDGMWFRASRKDAKPFTIKDRLPPNCILWLAKTS